MSSMVCFEKLLNQMQILNKDPSTVASFNQISKILIIFASGIQDLESKLSNVFLGLEGIQIQYISFKNYVRAFLNKLSPLISLLHRLISINPDKELIANLVDTFPMAELENLLLENYNLIDYVQKKISSISLWSLIMKNLLRDLVAFACIGGLIGLAFSSIIPFAFGVDILVGVCVGGLFGCIIAIGKAVVDYFSGKQKGELQIVKDHLQSIKDLLMEIKKNLEHVQDSLISIVMSVNHNSLYLIKEDCEKIAQEIENIRNFI